MKPILALSDFRSTLASSLALVVPILCAGCALFYLEREVDPELGADLRDKRAFVVPFKEPGLWYGDSEDGRDFRMSLLANLQNKCYSTDFVVSEEVLIAIVECVDEEVPWARFGRQAGADMIVFGEIETLSFQKKDWIGMLQGQLEVELSIFDVAQGRVTYEKELSYSFPDDPESGEVMAVFGESQRELRHHLFKTAAKELTKIMCGGTEDIYER